MGDGRSRDADDESWTEVQDVQPELVEAVPIRHGMVLGGRYAVERIIGRGGSGLVVRAHDRDLRVSVAIKIVRSELAGQRVWAARLAREVKLARQIHHPHVCRVFDFQQADGRVFLVMELAEKGTLRDEIRSGVLAARPLAERIADARAVASALAAIHEAGIVHRDLSLQNLLRMGDGRLVLSDFGLAVDVSDSTSSVHGGTVAYMAPEVVRGGKASVASDIWALGVVMHEMVFGVKPLWAEAEIAEMREPEFGRRLTEEERAVLETCRACTAREPARRIPSAAEAGALLTDRQRRWPWRRAVAARRPMIWAGALALVAAVAGGLVSGQRAAPVASVSPAAAKDSPLIVPTGEAADWTDVSTVLAEVPERITCTRLLPDQRSIRFVWGSPPRAEDIDTVTQRRVPSPLVPAAYVEGCPDLSPNGKRLVFQGHAANGSAFAFLSERSDGKGAVPVVQTAEPTMSSEPTWLADGQAFSYDIDVRHMGVFSLTEDRVTVLPGPPERSFVTSFRFVTGGLIFVSGHSEPAETEIVGFSWPLLQERVRLRYSGSVLDLISESTSLLYFTDQSIARSSEVIELDRAERSARRLGRVRDRLIRYPRLTAAGLTFLSVRFEADLYARATDGTLARVTNDGKTFNAARCGDDFVVQRDVDGKSVIERIDRTGARLGAVSHGVRDAVPGCSPDGRTVFYSDHTAESIIRCDQAGCRPLSRMTINSLTVSPDGRRLALLVFEPRGIGVWLMMSDGSGARHVAETETACQPGWASAETLWISRRRNGNVVWFEVDADSGRETGKTVRGSRECSDAKPDPASPVEPDIRIVYDERSQLRILDRKLLLRN